jgi:hypothetical protein
MTYRKALQGAQRCPIGKALASAQSQLLQPSQCREGHDTVGADVAVLHCNQALQPAEPTTASSLTPPISQNSTSWPKATKAEMHGIQAVLLADIYAQLLQSIGQGPWEVQAAACVSFHLNGREVAQAANGSTPALCYSRFCVG